MRHFITYLLMAVTAAAAPSVAPNGMIVSNGLAVSGSLTVNGTTLVVAASAALTNGQTGVTLAGTFSGNGTGLSNVLMATALTNGGFSIGGQSVTNGGDYSGGAKIGYQDTRGFTNGASAHFTNATAEVVVGAGDPTHYGYGRIWIVNARDVNVDAGSMSGDWLIGGSVLDDNELAGMVHIYATNLVQNGTPIARNGRITTNALAGVDGSLLTNVNALTLSGIPAGSFALVSSFGNVGRYTNFPATATSAGAAGQWAVTNVGSTNWLAVWGANFQGTGTNGWGFMQLQRARP